LPPIASPFSNSPLGIHVAAGDLDGDGLAEIIMGPGRGDPALSIWNGKDKVVRTFNLVDTFPQAWGVNVATGDLDGDGLAEIAAFPATGPASNGVILKTDPIKIVKPATKTGPIFLRGSGGVNVATGDLDGDGLDEIIAGANSKKRGWDPVSIKVVVGTAGVERLSPPLPPGAGGIEVAAGDVDGDGFDDVLVLPKDPQGGVVSSPFLRVGEQKTEYKWIEIQGWNLAPGVHVAMGDVVGDGVPELIVGSAVGTDSFIKVYPFIKVDAGGVAGIGMGKALYEWIDPGPIKSKRTGIRVAVGDVNGDGFSEIAFARAAVPEPTTLGSLLLGVAAWLLGGRRSRGDGGPPG
jgi:hypothetical protein